MARADSGGLCLALAVVALMAAPRDAAAQASDGQPPFWERVGSPGRERFDRLYDQAEAILSANDRTVGRRLTEPERLAQAEALLHEALAARPDDFRALVLLAEVHSIAGRSAAAVAALERAVPRAKLPSQEAICWFRLGVERSKLGDYAEAVADYDRQVALGEADGTVYANSAEILMTLGRLPEAEDRYREAIRVDEQAPDRRAREHSLTLSYYGLGVALDRDEQPVAAREMVARALALDPNMSQLLAGQQPGSDVFFIPDGDVFYYIGLAEEVAGRPDDAEAAFREFLSRLPKSAWARRAQAHLEVVVGRGHVAHRTRAPLRVVAAGTVLASGGLPAPLVDAAWREHPEMLDACLELAAASINATSVGPAGRGGMRIALELEIDGRGTVNRVVAKVPAPLDAAFARCAEAAVRDGLRLGPPPGRPRPTRARMELVVANGDTDR
jgi:tetratricopeptide (TPR) repeat protein